MIEAGLRPTDPVRWWFAYEVETALAEHDQQTAGEQGGDIQVVDNESPTL